jgi:small subunit ribosomal protein S18
MAEFERDSDDLGGGRSGGRFGPRRAKFCPFCAEKVTVIPYKEGDLLRRFLTENGKIRPRRQTGVCARHQRRLAVSVKRARHLALIPFEGQMSRD